MSAQHHAFVAGGATRRRPDAGQPPAGLPPVGPPFRLAPVGID